MIEEKPYIIIYSNWFEFEGRVLAFRKKELFDITETPRHIPFVGHWNINRKQLSVLKAKELIKHEPTQIDVSNLQWYTQIELNECFNLEKYEDRRVY